MQSDTAPFQTGFIPGLDLSEAFYKEAIEPLLDKEFPGLSYSAALIGSGSEILGYDTEMSTDHHWGPRVMLFLTPEEHKRCRQRLNATLGEKLPRLFLGYPTGFTQPDPNDHGTQLLDYSAEGPVNHRVEIHTIEGFFADYLGFDIGQEIKQADWLTFPEQKLVTVVSGRVFHDQVGLEKTRQRFKYYPTDVWLYLLASQWTRIEQEEHLMGRAGYVGDEIGSAIIGSRLVRDLMRLCFLMEKRYAPYQKWFGTAFSQLKAAPILMPILRSALSASNWEERQKHLAQAYEYVAKLHNELGITEPVKTAAHPFFDRPFLVISSNIISGVIAAKIADPVIKELAKKRLIGSIDQWSDSTDILSDSCWRPVLRKLYE